MKTSAFVLELVLQLNKEEFEKYVYNAATEGDLLFIKKLFLISSLNKKFKNIYNPQLLVLLGAVNGGQHEIFEYIIERQIKTGYEMSLKKQEILFNNICWKDDLKLLKYIDSKWNVSERMLLKANLNLFSKNNKNNAHIKLNRYECNTNGYLVGCAKNNVAVVDYLLSKKNITKELIEEGFLNACANMRGINIVETFVYSSHIFVSETMLFSVKIKEYLELNMSLGHNIDKNDIKELLEQLKFKNDLESNLIESPVKDKRLKV